MKKKTIEFIAAALMLFATAKSQNHKCIGCEKSVETSNAKTAWQTFECGTNINDYVPTASTPPLVYRVNVHLFKKSSSPGIYDSVTLNDVNYFIYLINQRFANLQPPQLLATPVAPFISDAKISFVLTGLHWHTDDNVFLPNSFSTHSTIDATYAINSHNTINMYFISDPATNGAMAPGYIIGSHPSLGWGFASMSDLYAHELGHVPGGLFHTNSTSIPADIYAEPNSIFFTSAPCGSPNSSNNIMSYNDQCRTYISPHQIASFHHRTKPGSVGAGSTVRYTQECDYDNTKSITITNAQTWTKPENFRGDITIAAGGHLTIKCYLNMTTNSRIVVNKGGKLTLDGGIITSLCGGLWNGIEIVGDNTQSQAIDLVTLMPLYQGMVEMKNNSMIVNARTGVSVGQRSSPGGSFISGTGGGIIQSTASNFEQNIVSVEFLNYVYTDPTKPAKGIINASFFKQTGFAAANSLMVASALADTRVILYGVRGIKFLGCTFSGDGNYGIKSTDASFLLQDYCTNMSGTSCVGTVLRNSFNGLNTYYAIHATNTTNFWPSTIDHCTFGQGYKQGAIYLSAVNNAKINNNSFTIGNYTSPTAIYGAYLNGCTFYTIQNNIFYGTGNITQGLVIQGSGANANEVYNNTFTNLTYGLWSQRQNVNWSNGVGLKFNCNDFNNCIYNIGVQGPLTFNNQHGIAFTQGIENGTVYQNVRNTYNTPACNPGAENKFYIDTYNPLYLYHGSFSGTQFHPTPQTNGDCSNSAELNDVFGSTAAPTPKSAYCPVANPPISAENFVKLPEGQEHSSSERSASQQQLSHINSSIESIKQRIEQLNQEANGVSQQDLQKTKNELSWSRNELELLLIKKIDIVLNSELSEDPLSEVKDIFSSETIGNSKRFLIILEIERFNYSKAMEMINSLKNEGTEEDRDFCEIQEIIINLKKDNAYFAKVNSDERLKSRLYELAQKEGPAQLPSVAILEKTTDFKYKEELMRPRIISSTADGVKLTEGDISVYPNPTKNIVNINVKNQNAEMVIVSDITGKVLLSQEINEKAQINTENLSSGIYIIQVTNKKNVIYSNKLVVIK
ncbi:MAG: C-terminal target protein [Bacteroidetes bacterium]|nr:C-terminal target protein [Bacteroidota bacterium]